MAAQDLPGPATGPAMAKAAPIDETLSSIATTSTAITRFLRGMRSAHADLAAVTRELSDLRLLLELMRDEQDIPLLLQAQALALLQDCRAILLRIRVLLERCSTQAQWTSIVKPDMTALRQSLEIFRRALGFVLDVVHLSSLPRDASELGEIEDQIHNEVDELRIEAALVEPIDESAMPVLLSYLNAIVSCLQKSDDGSSPNSNQSRSGSREEGITKNETARPQKPSDPPVSTRLNIPLIEDDLEAVDLDQQLPIQSNVDDQNNNKSVVNRQFETAGPWHPTRDIVLPFYHQSNNSPGHSPAPAPPQHTTPPQQQQQQQQPVYTHTLTPPPPSPPPRRPTLSHSQPGPHSPSPISPHTRPQHSPQSNSPVVQSHGHGGPTPVYPPGSHSPASSLSQQMWNQQMWKHNATSPVMRSDSFNSQTSIPDFRTFGVDKNWVDPARDFIGGPPNNGYTYPASPHHSSRDPSIASIASVTSVSPPSTAPTDSPRSIFSTFGKFVSHKSHSSVSSSKPPHPTPLSPTGHWHQAQQAAAEPASSLLYQQRYPQHISPLMSSSSSTSTSTSKPSLVESLSSPSVARLPPTSQLCAAPYTNPIEIVPTRHLTDKGKPHDVFHIDTSPTSSSWIATKHSNNHVKVWSVARNAVHSDTKITSYVTPQARSREYFIRSHAILSESATLIAITTHFGFNLEIHNFSKAGSSSKRLQTIDEAHRWAASRRDAYQTNYAPLVVYRPKTNRIDKFLLARHPSAKKPFWEDASSSIDLERANLPFVPKFPELAYSANSPFLIAAAGPRPGENASSSSGIESPYPNPNPNNNIMLAAWQMTAPVGEQTLQSRNPAPDTASTLSGYYSGGSDTSSLVDMENNRHRPHRFITPSYPSLQNALPSALAAHSTTVVSIWIPANHADIPLPGGKFRRTPVSAPERFVLVWDLMTNAARIFGIPNVQACVSPDCRFVAYCDPGRAASSSASSTASGGTGNGRFVIIDVASGEECWRWPPREEGVSPTSPGIITSTFSNSSGGIQAGKQGKEKTPWASFGGQMENLGKVTVFEFSSDSRMLIVGDASGGLGIYEVRESGHGPGGRYELAPADNSVGWSTGSEFVSELPGNGQF